MNNTETKIDPSPAGLEASPALIQALNCLLRPLVRLLLAKQMTYPYLITLLKPLFVDVAAHEFPLSDKRQTDSRLSLLTGVHRKDVRRLLSESVEVAPTPVNVSLGARLVARWNGEADYLDSDARPIPLPRLAQSDGAASFERLVSEGSKDIRSRAVLDEWLRLGLVELDAEDRVCLRSGAFVAEHGSAEKLYYLGRNVRDHLETAVHNVLDQQPPLLERSVYADGLSQKAVAELAEMAEDMGMTVLRALNQRARELKKNSPGEENTQRMTLGIYFYTGAQRSHTEATHDTP